MLMSPRKVKYRKVQRGSLKGLAGTCEMKFGDFALQAVEPGWLNAQQMESVRVTLSRRVRKAGKFWFRVFPHKPVTKKPAETRMGKGKGNVEFWVAVVKRECVILEIAGLEEPLAKKALKVAACRIPMKTRIIKRLKIKEKGA